MSTKTGLTLKSFSGTRIDTKQNRPIAKSKIATAAPRQTVKKTPIVILKTLLSDLNIPEEFYDRLQTLTYNINGSSIFESTGEYNNSILMEIAGLIRSNSPQYALNFLNNVNSPDNIYWDQPIFESIKKKIENEMNNDRTKVRGSVGVEKCKFCPSKEIVYKFAQTSGSDEATTIFYTCVSCDRNWKSK